MTKVLYSCLLVSGFAVLVSSGKCPYAKFTSPSEVHTACLQPNTSCNIVSKGVSPKEQTLIVKLHNDIRNKVASGQQAGANNAMLPQAADMRQLTWNQELAMLAQAHADQCSLTADCYRCRATEDYPTGENLYYQFLNAVPKKADWSSAVTYWLQSAKDLASIKANNYKYSAFTQVAWAQTKNIGCALTRFRGTQYRYIDYFVCLYGPAGNYADKNVYEAGVPCSDCSYKNTCCGSGCQNAGQDQNLCKSTV